MMYVQASSAASGVASASEDLQMEVGWDATIEGRGGGYQITPASPRFPEKLLPWSQSIAFVLINLNLLPFSEVRPLGVRYSYLLVSFGAREGLVSLLLVSSL